MLYNAGISGFPGGRPRATAGHGIGLFQNVPHHPGDNPPLGYAYGAVTWLLTHLTKHVMYVSISGTHTSYK